MRVNSEERRWRITHPPTSRQLESTTMARSNYSGEKRRKELEKQRKKAAKKQRKLDIAAGLITASDSDEAEADTTPASPAEP